MQFANVRGRRFVDAVCLHEGLVQLKLFQLIPKEEGAEKLSSVSGNTVQFCDQIKVSSVTFCFWSLLDTSAVALLGTT